MSNPTNIQTLTNSIKAKALEIGFDACGITKAEYLHNEEAHLKQYLAKAMHGEMNFMENHFKKRLDTSLLVEGGKSVIMVLLNYCPKEKLSSKNTLKVSKYAYGKNYHVVMKSMLKNLLEAIQKENSDIEGRFFVDSAPILEKALAASAGLGWIGKNSLLINKQLGSFVFIGEIVVNVELEYDDPIKDQCGQCQLCIDACPVNAIEKDKIVNASKCISYHTIEMRTENLPVELKGKMDNWIFGCDACQDVCPWNKKVKAHNILDFDPHPDLLKMDKKQWLSLTESKFMELFKNSPIERTKYSGFKRNIDFVSSK